MCLRALDAHATDTDTVDSHLTSYSITAHIAFYPSESQVEPNISRQNGKHAIWASTQQHSSTYVEKAAGSFYIVNLVIVDCVYYIVSSSPTNCSKSKESGDGGGGDGGGTGTLTLVTRMQTDRPHENDNYI